MKYIPVYSERLVKFKKKLEKLTEAEKGYLAGILDGEGSIGLYRVEYRSKKRTFNSIMTRITFIVNVDKRLIDYIGKLLGEEFIYKGNNNTWCVKTSHRAFAEVFLQTIYPYLIAKKDRAKNAIKFINIRKGRFHHKYEDRELELVELSKKGNYKMGKAIK